MLLTAADTYEVSVTLKFSEDSSWVISSSENIWELPASAPVSMALAVFRLFNTALFRSARSIIPVAMMTGRKNTARATVRP